MRVWWRVRGIDPRVGPRRKFSWGLRVLATSVAGAVVLALAPAASATDYGASLSPQAPADEARWLSRSTVARVFDTGTLDTWDSYPPLQRAYDAGIRKFVISWKGTTGAEIRAFAATIPADATVFGTWWHEPENDIASGEFTLRYWKRTMVRLCGVMRKNGIIPIRVLMAWSLFPQSGRNIRSYDLPKGTIAIAAFDGHVYDKMPRNVARHLLAEKRRNKLPLAMAETSGPAKRIRTLRHLLDGKMRWATYLTRDGMTVRQANAWFGRPG